MSACDRRLPAEKLLLQVLQRTDELLVVAPASHGTAVNLLSHLPGAGSDHLPLVRMELQHPWVPFETDKIQHFARPGFLIADQFLVGHVENEPGRQYLAPMHHHPPVFAVIVGEIRQVEREVKAQQELLEIAGQAGIDGISLHVDDSSVGEHRVDQAQKIRVHRRLIDDARRIRGGSLENAQILFGHLGAGRLAQNTPREPSLRRDQSRPKMQLSGTVGGWMRRDNLLSEGSARARHPDHEDRLGRGGSWDLYFRYLLLRVNPNQLVNET